jgi:hypothetical protein
MPVRRSRGTATDSQLRFPLQYRNYVLEVTDTGLEQLTEWLAEAKALQTLRREREGDAGASLTIEVAILRTNAELECVEAAEAGPGSGLSTCRARLNSPMRQGPLPDLPARPL